MSEDELKDWLRKIQLKETGADVDRKWKAHGLKEDDNLKWEQHVLHFYGSQETSGCLNPCGVQNRFIK